jgi:quercetin dioxygenase-like cupin family protein
MAGLWGGPLPPGVRRRSLVIPPGSRHAYRPSDWKEAIVMVQRGEIELECPGQPPRRFGPGDLLWLGGPGPGALRNRGPGQAVRVVVSKQPRSHA